MTKGEERLLRDLKAAEAELQSLRQKLHLCEAACGKLLSILRVNGLMNTYTRQLLRDIGFDLDFLCCATKRR